MEKEKPTEQTEVQEEQPEQIQEEDLIQNANAAAERLENANARLSSLLDKQERLQVKETLAGSSEAGTSSVSKEDKIKEETKEFLKGTGYEDMIQ